MDKNVSPSIIPDFHALLITPAAMRIHDEHLSAYIDGRLQTEEKAAVEARLKDDAARRNIARSTPSKTFCKHVKTNFASLLPWRRGVRYC
jgi:hypothetical protein